MTDLAQFLIGPTATIWAAMACIDQNAKGIALVVQDDGRLIGTITDGDIRRAILQGIVLDSPVQSILERKSSTPYPVPVTAHLGAPDSELVRLMNKYAIRQVPLLDDGGHVVDVAILAEVVKDNELPLTAVIMAGGYGTRLYPLTKEVPKPMLRVGDRPLLEHIVERLRQSGIRRVKVTTHYLSQKIREYFDDGKDFGVEIDYVSEDQPLGTAGALGLIEARDQPLLVMNGDILTRVDFHAMLAFHQEHKADMTIGVRQYDLEVPYGVLECEGPYLRHVREKPTYHYLINAGIYLLEPTVHTFIRSGEKLDMTDLIERLLGAERTVVSFPIVEYWLDIGQHDDYEQALKDIEDGRFSVELVN